MSEEGILVYSDKKHVEHLKKVMPVKERDPPADGSFLQEDKSSPLEPGKAKLFREMTGRLLYLASTRPDIQFGVCSLSSKMSTPTELGWQWLKSHWLPGQAPGHWLPNKALQVPCKIGL